MTGDLKATAGSLPASGTDPVRRLVAAWLLGYESQATRRNYALDLSAWLGFCESHGADPLRARRAHVDAWARTMQTTSAAQRSVARRLAAASSWYRYLVAEGVRPDSPVEHVRRPKIGDRGETPGLTRDELRRLLAAATEYGSKRSFALLSLLAHTGLRINEALSRDVEHLAHDRGHRILRLERKGGKGDRTVLTPPVARAIDDYLDGAARARSSSPRRPSAWASPRPGRWSGAWPPGPASMALARSARTRYEWRSSPEHVKQASLSKTCKTLPDTLILARHGGMTGGATPSTDTPPMRSRLGWPSKTADPSTPPSKMADTIRVHVRDFFVLDEDSTIEVNGGHPPIYVLNEWFLGDLAHESLPLANDASVAEGLLDLVCDELVGYGTDGSNKLDDKQVALAIRALEAVTWRLGVPIKLPFRNFTTFRSYWIRDGASGHGGWQARRDIVAELLDPTREQLTELRRGGNPQINEDLIANLRDPAAIREHLARLQRTAESDPPLAIGTAKELVESTAKTVLRERGLDVDDKDDLPALVKRAQEALGLHPSTVQPGPDGTDDAVKRILGGLTSIAAGLGELRNRGYGTGHGPKGERVGLRPRHARLAVNAWCSVMLDTLADTEAPWRTSGNPMASPPGLIPATDK